MNFTADFSPARARAEALLGRLTLREKIGQLVQVNGAGGWVSDELRGSICRGEVGSVINEVDPDTVTELQRIARTESAHGIPLLMGRDVIHGFKTVLPIPLAMAATWNDALVEQGARVAAMEASHQGINWTFSPMVDVARDPRWGRIAESFGEDPCLGSRMAGAMVRGYQQDPEHRLLSCPKHFAGYGASESGKDYNTTSIPETELRNVHLPPFRAALRAGSASIMTSFSDLNGRPATGNAWLLRDLLREEWGFAGFVVSDWASITQLAVHGVAEDARDAARQAALAGVSMDMVSGAYAGHLEELVATGDLAASLIDELALEVLTVKFQFGLFDQDAGQYAAAPKPDLARRTAYELAVESVVLLKNRGGLLPLEPSQTLGLIGPLADQPGEQLGTWVFDGEVEDSVSVRQALAERIGDRLRYSPGLATSRDKSTAGFDAALDVAASSDLVILVLGEEAILSGEAHCRSDISLPGAQVELAHHLLRAGKPLVVVVMAGRPLVLAPLVAAADAILYACHPGSCAGPALGDLLFGDRNPSGKLPVTLPRSAGQIPIYYAHGNTGKPATPETIITMDDIDAGAHQSSVGNTSFHLDVHPSPQFAFGFGLSFTTFEYANLHVLREMRAPGDLLEVALDVTNTGGRAGAETVQLYVRDVVARITRPVRELKAYRKVSLEPGECRQVRFALTESDLSFFDGREWVTEPGRFLLWAGGDSNAELAVETRVLEG